MRFSSAKFLALATISSLHFHQAVAQDQELLDATRAIFDRSFDSWLAALEQADVCGVQPFDDDEFADVVQRASAAFYPGFLNWSQRSAYEDALVARQLDARRSGRKAARKSDCFKVDSLVVITRSPIDAAINAAMGQD